MQAGIMASTNDTCPDSGNWYGPKRQFYPHWIFYEFFHAIFRAIGNTVIGLGVFIAHPKRSVSDIVYAITHISDTLQSVVQRATVALRTRGIVFCGMCILCSIILPGAGLFGKLAEISEHGRKTRINAAGKQVPVVTAATNAATSH
jgi:hypothetical protein